METNENHALTKAEGCYHCKPLVQQRNELTAQVERLKHERDEALAQNERLRESVEVLMANSHGVAGLHLNGDIASWGELTEGGRFEEWLLALSEQPPAALAALKAQWQAEAVRDFADECGISDFTEQYLSQRTQEPSNAHPNNPPA